MIKNAKRFYETPGKTLFVLGIAGLAACSETPGSEYPQSRTQQSESRTVAAQPVAETAAFTIYNNTPIATHWVVAREQGDDGTQLSLVEDVQPGESLTLDIPLKEDGTPTVGVWGVASTQDPWRAIESYNYVLSDIVAPEMRTEPGWYEDYNWTFEAEEGDAEFETPLPEDWRYIVNNSPDPIYMRVTEVDGDSQVEALNAASLWINAGETLEDRAQRSKIYADALRYTAIGLNNAQDNAAKIGRPDDHVRPIHLGLTYDPTNPDWLGLKVDEVTPPYVAEGAELPWTKGDLILEFNGNPIFNEWQLYALLIEHERNKGIESPCAVIVMKPNKETGELAGGTLMEYQVPYYYDMAFFGHFEQDGASQPTVQPATRAQQSRDGR